MPEILKKLSKQGIDLQPFQIFKTTRSMFDIKQGVGSSVFSMQKKDTSRTNDNKKTKPRQIGQRN